MCHFSPGRKAIHKNKRVYSPCPCKLVYLGVFVALGRCGVSVGGEMSHKKNRKRSVFPNGIGTGLPEGNNMAGEFITKCVPQCRIVHPFLYCPNNSNISEGLSPNHLAPVSKSTGAHCQKHRRTSAVVPLTGSTVHTCLRMAGKASCLSLE